MSVISEHQYLWPAYRRSSSCRLRSLGLDGDESGTGPLRSDGGLSSDEGLYAVESSCCLLPD